MLENHGDDEKDEDGDEDASDFEMEKLVRMSLISPSIPDIQGVPTFESLAQTSDLDSDADWHHRPRAVRFSRMREVRLLPANEAALAVNARMPYRDACCSACVSTRQLSPVVKLAAVFAPLVS